MILILGGTTEGRSAVRVIEQAGKPYYYSTKSDKQQVECVHGIRLTGGMDAQEMEIFCREKKIKLMIDAAHPFASLLHQHIATVSKQLDIPVIRFERMYPERNKRFIWCNDFDDAIRKLCAHAIGKLLALSGVNTIAPLRPYWENKKTWFRILNRKESLLIAEKQGFPKEQLVFFNEINPGKKEENTLTSRQYCDTYLHANNQKSEIIRLVEKYGPDAILTKESGYSGSFEEKVNTASDLNIPVFVVKRPALPEGFIPVYGEVGLRMKTERLLSGFFPLRMGYTTGVYATAAAKAALTTLITKEEKKECIIRLPVPELNVKGPDTSAISTESTTLALSHSSGEPIAIAIISTEQGDDKVRCTTVKDAGDDPDVTNKMQIQAEVYWDITSKEIILKTNRNTPIILRGGKGIGVVTLPGLGIDVGEPAINAIPRRMIQWECEEVLNKYSIQDKTPVIILSVPDGEEIAQRTFNPKLGIEGGISIIGTSGVVRPFSNEAFIATIRKEIEIAKATGCRTIVINSGAKSERYLKKQYPLLSPQAFIHYGNFIGEILTFASENKIPEIIMGIMIGKAVKLAEGALDTHSQKGTMNKPFIKSLALSAGCSEKDAKKIDHLNLARELWHIFPEKEQTQFLSKLIEKCCEQCTKIYTYGKLSILLINEEGDIFR